MISTSTPPSHRGSGRHPSRTGGPGRHGGGATQLAIVAGFFTIISSRGWSMPMRSGPATRIDSAPTGPRYSGGLVRHQRRQMCNSSSGRSRSVRSCRWSRSDMTPAVISRTTASTTRTKDRTHRCYAPADAGQEAGRCRGLPRRRVRSRVPSCDGTGYPATRHRAGWPGRSQSCEDERWRPGVEHVGGIRRPGTRSA